MEIIAYTQFDKRKKEILGNEIYQSINSRPKMVSNFKQLAKALNQKISGDVLIVFFISSMDELDYLTQNNGLLFNSRFIFILLNGNQEMVSKGLSLYPRYIAHMNRDFKDISAVVKRIVQYDERNNKNRQDNSVYQPPINTINSI